MRLPLFLTLMLSVLYANAQCCSLSAEGNLMRDTDALSLQATPYFYSGSATATITFGTPPDFAWCRLCKKHNYRKINKNSNKNTYEDEIQR